MQEYVVIEKGPLLKLRAAISTLVGDIDQLLNKGVGTLNLGEKESKLVASPIQATSKSIRSGGLKDVLYTHAPSGAFSARAATDALEGKYKFATKNRQIDSVRNALRNDDRFEKLPDGRFKRKEPVLEGL